MPKPKGKTGPSKGHNKNFKRRPTTTLSHDYIPDSAVDREPDADEPEDGDSTSSKLKIDVPVAMWVCETTPSCDSLRNLLKVVRILVIATQNAARVRSSLALD
jgi:hypothetical protein